MSVAAQRAWMEQWRHAAVALEAQRRRELRAMSDAAALAASDALLALALRCRGSHRKDWVDIEGIAVRQRGRLDEGLIWTERTPLLELTEPPEAGERLRAVLTRARD